MSKKHTVAKSFGFAISGLRSAIKKEPNFRVHLILAALALILAILFQFSTLEWLMLLFSITFVLIFELLNTTLEAIVDLVSPEIKEVAKVAKDTSAAAVMVFAALAIIVGIALFLPKLI